MRFSVIIRTHNRHDMLQRAIMSARKAKMDEIVVAADPHCSEKVRHVMEDASDITKVWCRGGGTRSCMGRGQPAMLQRMDQDT